MHCQSKKIKNPCKKNWLLRQILSNCFHFVSDFLPLLSFFCTNAIIVYYMSFQNDTYSISRPTPMAVNWCPWCSFPYIHGSDPGVQGSDPVPRFVNLAWKPEGWTCGSKGIDVKIPFAIFILQVIIPLIHCQKDRQKESQKKGNIGDRKSVV